MMKPILPGRAQTWAVGVALAAASAATGGFCPPASAAAFDHVWSQSFAGDGQEEVTGIAVDSSGDFVITGYFDDSIDLGDGPINSWDEDDIFLAKYTSEGELLWWRRFGGLDDHRALDVAVDISGNVLITGYFENTNVDFGGGLLIGQGIRDIFVAKFDAMGDHLWSSSFGDPNSQSGKDIETLPSGEVLVSGSLQGTIDFGGGPLETSGFTDMFLVKFAPDGSHVWSHSFGSTSAGDVTIDPLANIVLTGRFQDTTDFGGGELTSSGSSDLFVAKFDSSGTHVWSFGHGAGSNQIATGVAADAQGNVFVTGWFNGDFDIGPFPLATAGGADIFLAKFDGDGAPQWSHAFGDSLGEKGFGVAADPDGDVVMTGYIAGNVDFGGGVLEADPGGDVFVAEFDSEGAHLQSESYGGVLDQWGHHVVVDAIGNKMVVGQFDEMVDFGGGPLVATGQRDIFLVEFGLVSSSVDDSLPEPRAAFDLRAQPNPFGGHTSIEFRLPYAARASLEVLDAAGRRVALLHEGPTSQGEQVVTWDGTDDQGRLAPAGVYFISLVALDQRVSARTLLIR